MFILWYFNFTTSDVHLGEKGVKFINEHSNETSIMFLGTTNLDCGKWRYMQY